MPDQYTANRTAAHTMQKAYRFITNRCIVNGLNCYST